jgi:hypothetical protein
MTSDCYCDYDYPPAFYSSTMRRARKEHRCYECGRLIAKGDDYEDLSAKWDDVIQRIRTCHRCIAMMRYVEAHVPCVCWEHGNILENARDTIDYYAHEAPGLVFGTLRRYVRGA